MSWLARAALCAALGLAATSAASRPFTIDDLLSQEQLGASAFDPHGRWTVFEWQGPYDQGPRFDLGQSNGLAASRLYIAAVSDAGPARPWLQPDPGPGQVFGGFSPSGARAAVFQLHGDVWRLGVVTTATGETRWLPVAPEALWTGRQLAWLGEDALLVLTRAEPGLPVRLREAGQSAARLPVLWATSARGGKARTVLGSGAYSPARERPAARSLVRVDLKDGTTRTVAEGEITDFEPAPDHNVVAILEAGADLQARLGRPLHGDWGLADQTQHLALVEVSTGRRADVCPGCDVLASLLSWSANSRSVLVFARGADAPWRAGAFWRFDTTGRGTRLTSAPFAPSMQLRPEVVQAGWLGGDPVALGRARPADPAAWYRLAAGGPVRLGVRLPDAGTVIAADAHDLSIIAGERLWRVDGHGGARRIGPDLPIRPLRTFTARDGRIGRAWSPTGWALARAGGVSTVLSVDVAGVAQVASIPDDASILATGPTGLLTQAPGAGGRLEVGLAGPDRPVRSLSTLNASLATVDALDVRAIDHAGPDGRPLRSWLFLPRREPGLPPPPLVVKVYSGDVYRDWPRPKPPVLGFVGDVRVLTGAGYAVLTPSLPAPDRRPAEPAAGLADRILAVVDAAARSPATAGTFDPERLALFGQSYGGYTVTAALTQTDRFRAAIDQSGYVDLVSEWAGLSATQRSAPEPGGRSNGATGGMESAQGRMGVPPWADPARYDRNSPLMAADKITTPLLILHGDQDGNVSLAQSEALFSALYRQGKDALLVTYWGEGHNIASPGNVRDLYTEVLRFLADHLNADGAAPRANPATASASAAPRPRPPRP